jgi:hypothetical protein
LWKLEKAYSLGIPKKKLALGESRTEEEPAYGEEYTMLRFNGRSFWTGSVERSVAGKNSGGDLALAEAELAEVLAAQPR